MFQERITLVSPAWRMVLLTVLGWLALGLLGPVVLRLEGELPITLQSLLVLIWAICWGWKVGVACLLYTSPSPRDYAASRMPSSA